MPEIKTLILVTQRKPLEEVVPNVWVRWLLRRIYKWYGFAARDTDGHSYFNVEYRGVFSNPGMARWAASCPGGAMKELPLDAVLPEDTVGFGYEDSPLSEASAAYRSGELSPPFITIAREELDALGLKIEQTVDCVHGKCVPKAV